MSDIGKNLLLWLVIAAVLLTVFNNFSLSPKAQVVPYSDFVKAVNQNQINEVRIQGDKINAVNKAGEEITGCTVHFVNEHLDSGAIIKQQTVPILPGDNVESVTRAVQQCEHQLLPLVLNAF